MPVSPNTPIMQADMDALALLANTNLLPLVNAAIAASEWGGTWTYDDDGAGNPLLTVFGGNNVFDRPEAMNIGDNAILFPQPDYVFDLAAKNWRSELNRMRGDYMLMVRNKKFGAESILGAIENIISGPWIVDVNDPETFPRFLDYDNPTPSIPLDGVFIAGVDSSNALFRDIEFWGLKSDLEGETMELKIENRGGEANLNRDWFNSTFVSATESSFSFDIIAHVECVLTFYVEMVLINYSGTVNPVVVSGATVITQTPNGTPIGGNYTLALKLEINCSVGINNVSFSTQGVTQYLHNDGTDYFLDPPGFRFDTITFSGGTLEKARGIIHPSETEFLKLKAPKYGGCTIIFSGSGALQSFTFPPFPIQPSANPTCIYSTVTLTLSNPSAKGVWVAKTLPTPGINVFLDQDMPPFVSRVSGSTYAIAVGDGNNVGGSTVVSSSMRVPTTGDEDVSKFGALKSGMAARPTPYQVLRSTDFVPWSYGYDPSIESNLLSNQVSGTFHSLLVPPEATRVKIRLIQAGTKKGWKNGVFQYGEPVGTMLSIYVKFGSVATPSNFDFVTTNNEVTINPDGGGAYLATILGGFISYFISNPTGDFVAFDLLTEIEISATQVKQYFPGKSFISSDSGYATVHECFSYCLLDVPAILINEFTVSGKVPNNFNKPVPQNGYCIFKIRATRLPALNIAGIAVTPSDGTSDVIVTIGQNILQPDNTLIFTPLLKADGITPYTVTIPAAARDSGDVAVFWPVLSGNELVYQCAEQVVLEAWANWQPIFFNAALGYGLKNNADAIPTAPNPTQFSTALAFVNMFFTIRAGYPSLTTERTSPYNHNVAIVQFPISVDIYNDLEAVLNLI